MNGRTTANASTSVCTVSRSDRRTSAPYPGSHSAPSGTSKCAGRISPRRSNSDINAALWAGASTAAALTMATKVHQIAVPGRGAALLAVAFLCRRDLVGDMVHQRIGPVAPLSHLGDHSTGQRRHVLWRARHAQVRSD